MKRKIRKIAVCMAAVSATLAISGAAAAYSGAADADTGIAGLFVWGNAALENDALKALQKTSQEYGPGVKTELQAVFPFGIAEAENGGLLIADRYHKAVWLKTDDEIKRYAGAPGPEGLYGEPAGGYADGRLSVMRMREPWAIIPYRDGYAVSDRANHVVRYLTADGAKTLAGTGTEGYSDQMANHALFSMPTGLAADPEGNLYIADTGNDVIRVMAPNGQVSTYAEGLNGPVGLSYYDGALYASDTGNHRIVKVQDGKITVVAGNGNAGYMDGASGEAEFTSPGQLAAASDGTLYVSDTGNGVVRKVSAVNGEGRVTTLSEPDSGLGNTEEAGANQAVSMVSPAGLLVRDDKLYVCDSFLRKIFILDR